MEGRGQGRQFLPPNGFVFTKFHPCGPIYKLFAENTAESYSKWHLDENGSGKQAWLSRRVTLCRRRRVARMVIYESKIGSYFRTFLNVLGRRHFSFIPLTLEFLVKNMFFTVCTSVFHMSFVNVYTTGEGEWHRLSSANNAFTFVISSIRCELIELTLHDIQVYQGLEISQKNLFQCDYATCT